MGDFPRDRGADDQSTDDGSNGVQPIAGAAVGAPARTAVRLEKLTSEDAGSRLDRVLARLLPGVPHTRLFRLLRKGEVRLNGKRATGETRVAEGDMLRIPPVS